MTDKKAWDSLPPTASPTRPQTQPAPMSGILYPSCGICASFRLASSPHVVHSLDRKRQWMTISTDS